MLEEFTGIVLAKRKYRDEDSIVKIMTSNYGKQMFFVKKGQLPSNRWIAQMLPFTYNQYIGTLNSSGFSFIREGTTIELMNNIQSDLVLQSYASYFVQLVDAAIDDRQVDKPLFHLLKDTLIKLNDRFPPELLRIYFEIHLLRYFGTELNWQKCVFCGKRAEPFDFSIRYGGLICRTHFHQDVYRLNIAPKAMHIAYQLANLPLSRIQSIKVSDETLAELKRLTTELYTEFVGIQLKSKDYVEKITETQHKYEALLQKRNGVVEE